MKRRKNSRGISRAEFARGSQLAPSVNLGAFRADQDAAYNQDQIDPYAR